ncbi:MAG: thermonuclease family protein [Candidatus Methanomethyliaceae archaeon]
MGTRGTMWMRLTALPLFLLAAIWMGPCAAEFARLIQATVTHVVDGDTAYMRIGQRTESVRFIGVDCPELSHPGLGIQEDPYGQYALAYTRKALFGKTVWLELDVVQRDKYGRLLAYVWLLKPTSTAESEIRAKMLNAKLLAGGYAQVMTIPPNVKYSQVFLKLQQEARTKKAGLWGITVAAPRAPPASPSPSTARYIGNKRTFKFHYATCYWVTRMNPSNMVPFKTRDEAIAAGYIPCKVCRP